MTYKLHMSGVITGSLNCFCLACDEFFKSPQDATDHIGTSEHQKKADAVQFSDKFPDDHIKKFKAGYYCEFCNVLMAIASKVIIHIAEDEHRHNKGSLLLKPLGPDVVAFGNVLIEEKAWHGLVEGFCSLCNVELDDENDHKTDAGHSLNMVLKPIQVGADNGIIRHLDDTAVQCLTCNKLLAPGRLSQHFDDAEHRELYAKRRIETNGACKETEAKENCQDKATDMTSVTENVDEIKKETKINNDANAKNKRQDNNNNEKSSSIHKSKILESIAKYQAKGININLETETAFCKKCSDVVTFDFMEIENHVENHSSAAAVDSDLLYPSNVDQNLNRVDINDKTTQSSDDQHNDGVVNDTLKGLRENVQNDSSSEEDRHTKSACDDVDNVPTENFVKCSQEEEARDFAKANKLTYNENNNQSYCRICEVNVPASLRSMKEHVAGTNHNRLAGLIKPSPSQPITPGKLSKQKTIEFIDSAYDVQTFFYIASVVNEEYCILRNSLYLISENNFRMRCFVCDINLPPYLDLVDHVKTNGHQNKFKKVPVITSEREEFIREVRPGLFHCGFCNLLVSEWTDMKRHLESSDHRQNRRIWEARLRHHLPGLHAHKMRQQLESMAMLRFFNMFRN